MNFHELATEYDIARRRDNKLEVFDFYVQLAKNLKSNSQKNTRSYTEAALRIMFEASWHREHRPYYSVWPLAASSLSHVRLTGVPLPAIKLPLPVVLLRFSMTDPIELPSGCRLLTIFVGEAKLKEQRRIAIWATATHKDYPDAARITSVCLDLGDHNMDVEQAICLASNGRSIEPPPGFDHAPARPLGELQKDAIEISRYVVGLCLLANDPDVIEPDVLSKDRDAWERTADPAIVARAIRRGKVGWIVGARLETSPHYRRSHFAIRWTGEGRTTPKLTAIKGSVVRRKRLSDVPTGYLDSAS